MIWRQSCSNVMDVHVFSGKLLCNAKWGVAHRLREYFVQDYDAQIDPRTLMLASGRGDLSVAQRRFVDKAVFAARRRHMEYSVPSKAKLVSRRQRVLLSCLIHSMVELHQK